MNEIKTRLVKESSGDSGLIGDHYQAKSHLTQLAQAACRSRNQFNLTMVREILTLYNYRAVAIQHHETSFCHVGTFRAKNCSATAYASGAPMSRKRPSLR